MKKLEECNICKNEYELTKGNFPRYPKETYNLSCHSCEKKQKQTEEKNSYKNNYGYDLMDGFKICKECRRIDETTTEFWEKDNKNSDGLSKLCVDCLKEERDCSSDERLKYKFSYAKYLTYHDKLFADEIWSGKNGLLIVKCKTCKKKFSPSNGQVKNRIYSTNSINKGEQHFYCSEECKDNCEIFGKKPEYLEKLDMVKAGRIKEDLHEGFYNPSELIIWSNKVRDNANWKCKECGSEDNLEAHHINPKALFPEQALDIVNGKCLCMKCHDKAHKEIHKEHGPLRKC